MCFQCCLNGAGAFWETLNNKIKGMKLKNKLLWHCKAFAKNSLAWQNCVFCNCPPPAPAGCTSAHTQFHPSCLQLILGPSVADRTWELSQGKDLARVMGMGQRRQAHRLLARATCFATPYAKSPVPLPDKFEQQPRTQDGVSCGFDLFSSPCTNSSLFSAQLKERNLLGEERGRPGTADKADPSAARIPR